jgi:hypothetical protein
MLVLDVPFEYFAKTVMVYLAHPKLQAVSL